MKLNITMYRNCVTQFEQCIRDIAYVEMIGDGQSTDGTPYRIYYIKQESKPQWRSFIEPYVQKDKRKDDVCSIPGVLILLQIDTMEGPRFLGLTYGSGHILVERDQTELDFGMKTTMSAANPMKLNLIDSRNVGGRTRQKRVASNFEATLGALEYDFDTDIPRLIGGYCKSSALGNRIDGADSLHITVKKKGFTLEKLAAKCKDIFNSYRSDEYKQHFDFIDIANERDKGTIGRLEAQLLAALAAEQNDERIALVCPDQIEQRECTMFRLSGLGTVEESDEPPTLDELYAYLRLTKNSHGLAQDCLKNVRIAGYDEDNVQRTPKHSLIAYIVFDTELDGKRYVLSNQKWFYVDDCYLRRVEARIGQIRQCSTPSLLPWRKMTRGTALMYHEEDYNNLYAADADFLVLDRHPFRHFGRARGNSQVEFADLYHRPTNTLFCVKRWNGSATMSHLLAQASVSAGLLRELPEYRDELFRQITSRWPRVQHASDSLALLTGMRFVYAIGTDRTNPRLDMLPVFSKVHMLKHVRMIEGRGFSVEVAWVPMV